MHMIDRSGTSLQLAGQLTKMSIVSDANGLAQYYLQIGSMTQPLNTWLGHDIALTFKGAIHCVNCQRVTNKSFSQGYCYPCFRSLARCDTCIMAPERCHYFEGTCREPGWGERHCLAPHVVYLANSSGAKVGITKPSQLPTRWLDQGATQGLPILQVATRQQSGLVEALLRTEISDRTSWQRMLKGAAVPVDLAALRDQLLTQLMPGLEVLRERFGPDAITPFDQQIPAHFRYPVLSYPTTVRSFNLDRTPEISGRLLGMKGQYLILDRGVINLRKYTGYEMSVRLTPVESPVGV